MNIYVDFDDCLCESARLFCKLVEELFGKKASYENMKYFELKEAFSLTEEQYRQLMTEGHKPDVILSYEETPGASKTIRGWIDSGHHVFVITGRPYSSYKASRTWLDRHGLEQAKLYHFNKYGRDGFAENSEFMLQPDDFYRICFDYAVEDSPSAFRFFGHLPKLKVMVFDRPWNRECTFPQGEYIRCSDWKTIKAIVG